MSTDPCGVFTTKANLVVAVLSWDIDSTATAAAHGQIGDWDTGGVDDMSELFCDDCYTSSGGGYYYGSISSFNDDISGWNTSSVTSFYKMFKGTYSFSQDIGDWETGAATSCANIRAPSARRGKMAERGLSSKRPSESRS